MKSLSSSLLISSSPRKKLFVDLALAVERQDKFSAHVLIDQLNQKWFIDWCLTQAEWKYIQSCTALTKSSSNPSIEDFISQLIKICKSRGDADVIEMLAVLKCASKTDIMCSLLEMGALEKMLKLAKEHKNMPICYEQGVMDRKTKTPTLVTFLKNKTQLLYEWADLLEIRSKHSHGCRYGMELYLTTLALLRGDDHVSDSNFWSQFLILVHNFKLMQSLSELETNELLISLALGKHFESLDLIVDQIASKALTDSRNQNACTMTNGGNLVLNGAGYQAVMTRDGKLITGQGHVILPDGAIKTKQGILLESNGWISTPYGYTISPTGILYK